MGLGYRAWGGGAGERSGVKAISVAWRRSNFDSAAVDGSYPFYHWVVVVKKGVL